LIEAALYIAAGFLVAVLAAMIVAPTIWRRAVYLTRKRIEASVPLTVSELQADKDRLRAEHAVAEKKLDVALRKQRDLSTRQAAEISDMTATLKARDATIADRDATIGDLTGQLDATREELGDTQADLGATQLELNTTNAVLTARTAELESTARLRDEAEKQAATAGEDLAEQQTRYIALEGRLGDTREKLRTQQGKARDSRADARQTAELLKTERAKSAELDTRLERAIARASDLEEKLARREKEITRLREARAGEEADLQELEQRALDAEQERAALEEELGDLTVRVARITKQLDGQEPEAVIGARDVKIAQLDADLKSERKRVKALTGQLEKLKTASADEGEAALRDEIGALAAEIVHMASLLEGDGSPIPELVGDVDEGGPEGTVSLAARVRALQAKAQSRRSAQPAPGDTAKTTESDAMSS